MSKAEAVYKALDGAYPGAECELKYGSVFELLVAVILSAQCTDKRVNEVTAKLFKICNTPADFVRLGTEGLAPLIYSCGFYNSKAKAIVEASKSIIDDFGGEVPEDFTKLLQLRGVGRKTANVVFAVGFGHQAIAVDTHVFRVSNRTGLAPGNTPAKVEQGLMAAVDKDKWTRLHHLLIFHGRYTCKSQRPECGKCAVSGICDYYINNGKGKYV